MEVIGAVASFIAIAQAVAAVPKISKVLKSIAKAQSELGELARELDRLHGYCEVVAENINLITNKRSPSLSIEEPPHLVDIRTELKDFVQELETILHQCSLQEDSDTGRKLERLKWLFKKKKAKQLRDQCDRIRGDLESLYRMFSDQAMLKQGDVFLEVHTVTSQALILATSSPPTGTSPADEEPCLSGDESVSENAPSLDNVIVKSKNSRVQEQQLVKQHELNPQSKPSMRCGCQCHNDKCSAVSNSSHLHLHGGIFLEYRRSRGSSCSRCSRGPCNRTRPSTTVQFRLPQFLWRSAISGTISFGPLPVITVSLRPIVIIRLNDIIWHIIKAKNERRFRMRIAETGFLVTDSSAEGLGLLTYIIDIRALNLLKVALDESYGMINNTEACRTSAWLAQQRLTFRSHRYSNDEQYQLNRYIMAADPYQDDEYGELSKCIELLDDAKRLRDILGEKPELARATGPLKETLLHVACKFNKVDAVRELLQAGAGKNEQDVKGHTPLAVALVYRALECADVLLEAGCDINIPDNAGYTAIWYIHHSNGSGGTNMLRRLLDMGASVSTRNKHGYSMTHLLALDVLNEEQAEQRLGILLSHGGRTMLDAKDKYGYAPLHVALGKKNHVMVKLLIAEGAQCGGVFNDGHSVLNFAAQWGTVQTMGLLKNAQIDNIDIRTRLGGWTTLDRLRYRQWYDVEDFLDPTWTKPTGEEVDAFEDLLRDIRDRMLLMEMKKLKAIISQLQKAEFDTAREELQELRQGKLKSRIDWEAETFRAIELDVRHGRIDLAIESLEEFIANSRERMEKSPFDEREVQPNWFDKFHPQAATEDSGGSDEEKTDENRTSDETSDEESEGS
ncbi:hypothetical protein F4778DRAFT_762362, partial [Xylariomycetidae sp. FL2044]